MGGGGALLTLRGGSLLTLRKGGTRLYMDLLGIYEYVYVNMYPNYMIHRYGYY